MNICNHRTLVHLCPICSVEEKGLSNNTEIFAKGSTEDKRIKDLESQLLHKVQRLDEVEAQLAESERRRATPEVIASIVRKVIGHTPAWDLVLIESLAGLAALEKYKSHMLEESMKGIHGNVTKIDDYIEQLRKGGDV